MFVQACLEEDGTCIQFTLCADNTIKLRPNGAAINGHDKYVCVGINEVCCTASPQRLAAQAARFATSTTRPKYY